MPYGLILVLALVAAAFERPAGAASPLAIPHEAVLPTLAPMLEGVLPGVVSISAQSSGPSQEDLSSDPPARPFDGAPGHSDPQASPTQNVGSGVIVDAGQGYILTNGHLIDQATVVIAILQDGRAVPAEIVGTDPETDLAVLRIKADGLAAIPFGDATRLRVGDYVVAIGSPFGLGQSASLGIISALGRTDLGLDRYESFIQTDASINPGSSGGALVDLDGRLVGINTAIVGPSGGNVGIGFAIPVTIARGIMQQLISHGEVRRGQLGIAIQDMSPELAAAFGTSLQAGTLISDVSPGSPAEKAGLQPGDIVTGIDGAAVAGASALRNAVGILASDAEILVTFERNGRSRSVLVRLSPDLASKPAVTPGADLLAGVSLTDAPSDRRHQGRARGALVAAVEAASPAAAAGLVAGDVIVSIDRQPVETPALGVALAKKHTGMLLLGVLRDGSVRFLVIIP